MCYIDGCTKPVKARGLCDMHVARFYRNGSATKVQRERHGLSKSTEYNSWRGMRARCNNPNHIEYKNYGARGIKVCDRWMHSFRNFLEDMGNKPSTSFSVERLDSNGNYSPENCIWADRKTQSNNTRVNRYLSFKGETKTIGEWADLLGIKYQTLWRRLFVKKLSPEIALTGRLFK